MARRLEEFWTMKIFASQFFKKGNILQPLPEVCRLYMYSGTHKPFCPFCEQVYCQEKTHEINNTFEFLFSFSIAAVLVQLVFLSLSRFFLNHRSLGISGSAILGYQLFIPSVSVPIIVAVKCHKHTSLKHIRLKMFGFVTKNLKFIFFSKARDTWFDILFSIFKVNLLCYFLASVILFT